MSGVVYNNLVVYIAEVNSKMQGNDQFVIIF